ncbi:MAG: hypothetical protein RIQ88_349 [Actinomycetota bacterium]
MISVTLSETHLASLDTSIQHLVELNAASRLANKDFTLWGKPAEAEASIRLGWVNSAAEANAFLPKLYEVKADFDRIGISRIVLCGMGGSSLAPEVISKTFGVELVILDSTNPAQVLDALKADLSITAVVVSSKSGSTVETDSQKRVFEDAFIQAGIDPAKRVVIVTDPGSALEKSGIDAGNTVFQADQTVGGRYSALTAFGLVPSGLAGVDCKKLTDQALEVSDLLASDNRDNPAIVLAAAIARTQGANGFKNKIGIISDSNSLPDFADWAEQLIAESTGKEHKGVLPVVLDEDSFETKNKLDDLLTVSVSSSTNYSAGADLSVVGELGAQFLLWEYATALASILLEVNPFDQPDVESAKIAARGLLAQKSDIASPDFIDEGTSINAAGIDISGAKDLKTVISKFIGSITDHGYFSIHAYVNRNENLGLKELRDLIAERTKRPTTLGFGPRFLHSTGQFHKGGPAEGCFLQIISKFEQDLAIPGRDFTFGELIASQAAGDAKVLAEHNRPVLTLLLANPINDLKRLVDLISEVA